MDTRPSVEPLKFLPAPVEELPKAGLGGFRHTGVCRIGTRIRALPPVDPKYRPGEGTAG